MELLALKNHFTTTESEKRKPFFATSPLVIGTSPLPFATSPLVIGTSPRPFGTSPIVIGTSPRPFGTSTLTKITSFLCGQNFMKTENVRNLKLFGTKNYTDNSTLILILTRETKQRHSR